PNPSPPGGEGLSGPHAELTTLFDVPPFLQPVLGNSPRVALLLYGGLGLFVLLSLLALWWALGPGPRRRRALARARRLLQAGNWAEALAMVRGLRQRGRLSAAWRQRLDRFAAECLKAAAA